MLILYCIKFADAFSLILCAPHNMKLALTVHVNLWHTVKLLLTGTHSLHSLTLFLFLHFFQHIMCANDVVDSIHGPGRYQTATATTTTNGGKQHR